MNKYCYYRKLYTKSEHIEDIVISKFDNSISQSFEIEIEDRYSQGFYFSHLSKLTQNIIKKLNLHIRDDTGK